MPQKTPFERLAQGRRMCRSFLSEPLPDETADRIIETATFAPSAGFTQGWKFLVFENDDAKEFFKDTMTSDRPRSSSISRDRPRDHPFPGIANAPLVIVVVGSRDAYLDRYAESDKGFVDRDPNRWKTPAWITDTAFASMLILLAAQDLGLGALFYFPRSPDELKARHIPEGDWQPVGIIAIGHRATDDKRSSSLKRGRRGTQDVILRPLRK